jgi:hypothetical protein
MLLLRGFSKRVMNMRPQATRVPTTFTPSKVAYLPPPQEKPIMLIVALQQLAVDSCNTTPIPTPLHNPTVSHKHVFLGHLHTHELSPRDRHTDRDADADTDTHTDKDTNTQTRRHMHPRTQIHAYTETEKRMRRETVSF